MIITMHGLSTMHGNMRTDIRIAKEAGYEALEIYEVKLLRYLDRGFKTEDLVPAFETYSIRPVCINALKNIERITPRERRQLLAEAEHLCAAAKILNCPTVQLVPLCGLQGKAWKEIRRLTAKNIAEIADIGVVSRTLQPQALGMGPARYCPRIQSTHGMAPGSRRALTPIHPGSKFCADAR